jgi:hypothetical protein
VKQDFTNDEAVAEYTIRNATKEEKRHKSGLFGLLTRINMTRDAMDDDEDRVLPTNFSAVGVILLEFVNALSEYMVSLKVSCRWQIPCQLLEIWMRPSLIFYSFFVVGVGCHHQRVS